VADLKFHQTAHSKLRQAERRLSLENIKNVVQYPDRKRRQYKGYRGGWVHTFEKTVDGTTLKVVAEIRNQDCWLITAYEIA
jgi:hypothetical protein